jgi:DNA modification methylase
MQLHVVDIHELVVPENRQRREFRAEEIVKLADSISQNGLIQPVVVRRDNQNRMLLVAGERRIKAMMYVWNFGQAIRCGEHTFDEGQVPCIYQGEMDPIDAFEMELEENIRRLDLTWQERAAATSQLFELRQLQASRDGNTLPTYADIAKETRGDSGSAIDETRKEILVSRHLDDPDVARAKTADDAFKILKRKEETRRNTELAAQIGSTLTADIHQLLQGDCLDILPTLPSESVDVFLTDPPYGIDADQFGDSGGRASAHFYDDSFTTWASLMKVLAVESFRLAKPLAHAYVFCDIENFLVLRGYMAAAGWTPFRTPLIWHNPTAMRTPWPEHGPQRKYQICLYAKKGDRRVAKIAPDIISYPSDENLGHQAQKPVDLYSDLLRRSARPGDCVLDPFCGSGPIFPAAHGLKCRAIGIELDAAAFGIAATRIRNLQ